MKGIKSAYPTFKAVDTSQGLSMWHYMLKEIPYEDLSRAVYEHIATSQYPPSIADLMKLSGHKPEKLKSEADRIQEKVEEQMLKEYYEFKALEGDKKQIAGEIYETQNNH